MFVIGVSNECVFQKLYIKIYYIVFCNMTTSVKHQNHVCYWTCHSFIMINDDINPINLSVSFGGIFKHDNL